MTDYSSRPLNKPFKSPIKGKKYTIIIMDKGSRKVIHFGSSTEGQFKDKIGLYSSKDNNDPKRKKAFYDRFGGRSTDKTSPLYYSQKYLW
jgi:hypothetical protein